MSVIPKIVWPVPSSNSGGDFGSVDDILAHLDGEPTGTWLLGRNGMWHGGIHITDTTTPWCALSGKAVTEAMDYPVPYKGEQALRCMADGEVVAYRVCKDSVTLDWFTGPLHCSGSFLLVRHYIQPGETEKSGLHFYTLYMHLAPYSAYDAQSGNRWITRDTLSAYGEMDWLTMKLSGQSRKPDTAGSVKTGTRITWDENDPAQTETRYGRTYGLVTLSEGSGRLKAGERVWILVDNHNIVPDAGSRPSWWKHLAPPAREAMQFDKVVSLAEPYAIKAGDSVGHLGYFQSPKENGYDARYQVHIECFSTDDNLETFLTNPEKAGEKNPQYLKYTQGMKLFRRGLKGEHFTEDDRPTRGAGILTLSKVEVKEEAGEKYYRIRPEGGYVQSPELLSQYDLGKLGFRVVTENPSTFDHLDQKTPPKGLVERIYQFLLRVATDDARPSHALVRYNYEQLLNQINRGDSPYSGPEYLRAVHNPSYRDTLQRMIVKHPGEWWHKKGDVIWQSFLALLRKNAPLWGKYSEAFLDKMVWMQDVTTEKLRSDLWHMHPVMFLGALINRKIKHTGLFTVQDGKAALRKIYDKYGKNMSVVIERMFRVETTHFTSGQYQHCGAPGMEVHGEPPAYGWSSDFFSQNPEYQPTGIWSKMEGKGLSEQGGNAQVTDKPKQFLVFDSVESSMEYIVYYINKHGGNYARWYSTQDSAQKLYRKKCEAIIPKFTNEFSEGK